MVNKILKCIFVLVRYQNLELLVFTTSILFDYRLLFVRYKGLDLLVDSEWIAGDDRHPGFLMKSADVGVGSQHNNSSVEINYFFGFDYSIFIIVLVENQNHWVLEVNF